MTNTLIICDEGLSEAASEIVNAFRRGAVEIGHRVERITTGDKSAGLCPGCTSCLSESSCAIGDDLVSTVNRALRVEAILWVVPYSIAADSYLAHLLERCRTCPEPAWDRKKIYFLFAPSPASDATTDVAKQTDDLTADLQGTAPTALQQLRTWLFCGQASESDWLAWRATDKPDALARVYDWGRQL